MTRKLKRLSIIILFGLALIIGAVFLSQFIAEKRLEFRKPAPVSNYKYNIELELSLGKFHLDGDTEKGYFEITKLNNNTTTLTAFLSENDFMELFSRKETVSSESYDDFFAFQSEYWSETVICQAVQERNFDEKLLAHHLSIKINNRTENGYPAFEYLDENSFKFSGCEFILVE